MNLLERFFNSKSDANEFLEASQQEKLEIEFAEWSNEILNDEGLTEKGLKAEALSRMDKICQSSLSPDSYDNWKSIITELSNNIDGITDLLD